MSDKSSKENLKYRRTAEQLCYLLGPAFPKWNFTKVSVRRLTPYQIGHWLAETAAQRWGRECVLWDAFANIGSDAEKFAQHFSEVICSESEALAQILEENLATFQVRNARIDDSVEVAATETWPRANIVYLNPVWGSAYDRVNRDFFDITKVSIGSLSFGDIIQRARKRYHVIVVTPSKGIDLRDRFPSDFTMVFAQLTFHFYDRE